ncbi:hypothetical protein D3C71_1613460 [compost metagenome]
MSQACRSRAGRLAARASRASVAALLGAFHCRLAAMAPITKNGRLPAAPTNRMSLGSSARHSNTMMAPTTTLIHHDERSKIANTEFSAIFSFTGAALSIHRQWFSARAGEAVIVAA